MRSSLQPVVCTACSAPNVDSAETCFKCGKSLFVVTEGTLLAGRYEILRPLGKGGMGVVYEAKDRELDEIVALKVLRPEIARSGDMVRRFRSEIKLARKIRHRNVCGIHEFGTDGHLQFIAMELIHGVDLKKVLREHGPLPPEQAYEVSMQVAKGLQAIHDVGVVHRDLKTANLMRDPTGLVRLMDFGIAKDVVTESAEQTATGQIVGTPEYMSPEQIRAKGVDHRSDIYALGIVVWELFTGDVPFRGESSVATLFLQIQEPPPFDGPTGALIPDTLRPVLRKALAKQPEDRYQSVREFADAIRNARTASGITGVSGPMAVVPRSAAGAAPTAAHLEPTIVLGSGFTPVPAGTDRRPRAPDDETWIEERPPEITARQAPGTRPPSATRLPVDPLVPITISAHAPTVSAPTIRAMPTPKPAPSRPGVWVAGLLAAVIAGVVVWRLLPPAPATSTPATPQSQAQPTPAVVPPVTEPSPAPAATVAPATPAGASPRTTTHTPVPAATPRSSPATLVAGPVVIARPVTEPPPTPAASATPGTPRSSPAPLAAGPVVNASPVSTPHPGAAPLPEAAPSATTPPPPQPTATAAAPPPWNTEAAVRQALAAYVAAFASLDQRAIKAIYPTIPKDELDRLKYFKAYDMEIEPSNIQIDGKRARVRAQLKAALKSFTGKDHTLAPHEATITFEYRK